MTNAIALALIVVTPLIVGAQTSEFDASRVSNEREFTEKEFARKLSASETTNGVFKENDIFKEKYASELNTKIEDAFISRMEPPIRPEKYPKKTPLPSANISIAGNLTTASNKHPSKSAREKSNEIARVQTQPNEDVTILDLLRGAGFEENGPKFYHQTRHIYLGVPLYPYLFRESRTILPKNTEPKLSHAALYEVKQINYKGSVATEPSKIVLLSPGSFIPNADFNIEFFGGSRRD